MVVGRPQRTTGLEGVQLPDINLLRDGDFRPNDIIVEEETPERGIEEEEARLPGPIRDPPLLPKGEEATLQSIGIDGGTSKEGQMIRAGPEDQDLEKGNPLSGGLGIYIQNYTQIISITGSDRKTLCLYVGTFKAISEFSIPTNF